MKDCKVDGCLNKANRVKYVLCEKHYGRMRRHGSTDLAIKNKANKLVHTNGYLLVYAPDHPLAKSARVYEHRVVYYDFYGKGPFHCYHCGEVIDWTALHIDHLDSDKKNNNIDNLVASCAGCNVKRGRDKMTKTCRDRGINIEFLGETLHISDWAKKLGISRVTLIERLKRWSKEDALTRPKGNSGPK